MRPHQAVAAPPGSVTTPLARLGQMAYSPPQICRCVLVAARRGQAVGVTNDQIRARRRAREIVSDERWLGVPVPSLYRRMADEFSVLVQDGTYASWVAVHGDAGKLPV